MFDHEKLQVCSKAHRFLQIAESAAVKGAVYLDLAVERSLLAETEATAGKEILRRISVMVAGF